MKYLIEIVLLVIVSVFLAYALAGCYWPYYQNREYLNGKLVKEETLGVYTFGVNGKRQDIAGKTNNVILSVKNSEHRPDPNTVNAVAEGIVEGVKGI